jgi:hypothetical protein
VKNRVAELRGRLFTKPYQLRDLPQFLSAVLAPPAPRRAAATPAAAARPSRRSPRRRPPPPRTTPPVAAVAHRLAHSRR